jgi:hypothetical protein
MILDGEENKPIRIWCEERFLLSGESNEGTLGV